MRQQQLAFDVPDPAPGAPEAPGPAPVRHRQEFLDFLDDVTGRVREAFAAGDAAARPHAAAPATLRHTVRNAQMIAARARRAIDALPGTDLELLRAHGRLVAAAREAEEARRAAGFARGGRIFGSAGEAPRSSLATAETSGR